MHRNKVVIFKNVNNIEIALKVHDNYAEEGLADLLRKMASTRFICFTGKDKGVEVLATNHVTHMQIEELAENDTAYYDECVLV